MKYIYAIAGDSAQTISDKELSLEGYVKMNSERPECDWVASESGEWVEVHSAEAERMWRDKELLYVSGQYDTWRWAYEEPVKAYMQELADYTDKPDFPQCARPERPLTPKGNRILL